MVGFSNYDENHILSPTIFIQERKIIMSNIGRVNRSFLMMDTKLGRDHKEWNENVLKEICELLYVNECERESEQHHEKSIYIEPDEMNERYYALCIYDTIRMITNDNEKDYIKLKVYHENVQDVRKMRVDFIIDDISLMQIYKIPLMKYDGLTAYVNILTAIRDVNKKFGFENILDDVLTRYTHMYPTRLIRLDTIKYILLSEEFKLLFAHVILIAYLQLGLNTFIMSLNRDYVITSNNIAKILADESCNHLFNVINFGRAAFSTIFLASYQDIHNTDAFVQSINTIITQSYIKTLNNKTEIRPINGDIRPVLVYMVIVMFDDIMTIYDKWVSSRD